MPAQNRLYSAPYYVVLSESATVTTDLRTVALSPGGLVAADARPCRALTVLSAGGGTLTCVRPDGNSVALVGLLSGQELPLQAIKVKSGTVAKLLVLY